MTETNIQSGELVSVDQSENAAPDAAENASLSVEAQSDQPQDNAMSLAQADLPAGNDDPAENAAADAEGEADPEQGDADASGEASGDDAESLDAIAGNQGQANVAIGDADFASLSPHEILEIARPSPGAIDIKEVLGKKGLRFLFDLEDVRIIVLDVDVVLIFPDDAKVILPGLALQLVTSDSTVMSFNGEKIDEQAFLSKIADVKIASDIPTLNLAPGESAESTVEASSRAQNTATPQFVAAPTANPNEGEFEVEGTPEEFTETSTSTSSSTSSTTNTEIGPGKFDGAPAAGLTISILGDNSPVTSSLPGGGVEIRGAASVEQAVEDPSYSAQTARETLVGTANDDVIYAEDPTLMPRGPPSGCSISRSRCHLRDGKPSQRASSTFHLALQSPIRCCDLRRRLFHHA